MFYYCEKCGKKLISRTPNGVWHFIFGKKNNGKPVVDIQIQGSIKIKCLRRSCQHTNVFTFFPNQAIDTDK